MHDPHPHSSTQDRTARPRPGTAQDGPEKVGHSSPPVKHHSIKARNSAQIFFWVAQGGPGRYLGGSRWAELGGTGRYWPGSTTFPVSQFVYFTHSVCSAYGKTDRVGFSKCLKQVSPMACSVASDFGHVLRITRGKHGIYIHCELRPKRRLPDICQSNHNWFHWK